MADAPLPPHTGYAFPGLSNIHASIYPAIDTSTNPSLSQPGKVVLITGAGRGIGRSIALQYATASVSCLILCARTNSELDEVESRAKEINPSVRVMKFQLDVTSESAVKACFEAVRAAE
ncbi:NAD(P)-binding protein, partial [Lindgomyces ingoldianus]